MSHCGFSKRIVTYGTDNHCEDLKNIAPLNMAADTEMKVNGFSPRNGENSISNHIRYPDKTRIDLQWKNITYKAETGPTILKDLCGTSYSGELTAIMGPSGSGKTSLVNALSGFTQKGVTGEVMVNGALREMVSFRKLTCYILQNDHVLPRFTVRELLTFASNLKISSSVPENERQKAVNDCIYDLGLVGQQHQRANTLSGGQMKRLCIAQEIVDNPPLIFLDEPTSGLDSSSCLQCIQLLKSLAEGGRNVICTIHQPSSRIFEIFDNLYMLSEGDCIYRGPTKDLLPYLENQGLKCPKYHSPTDFLTDVAIGVYGEWKFKLKDAVKVADYKNDNCYNVDGGNDMLKTGSTMPIMGLNKSKITRLQDNFPGLNKYKYPTSNWNQYRVLTKRSFINMLRDPIHMQLKFTGGISIGLLLGTLFYDTANDASILYNTSGLLFTLLVFIIITSKIPAVLTFPLQRLVFVREHFNGWYNTKMYYLASMTAETPLQIFCPIVSCGLTYWLTGHPLEISRISLFMLTGVAIALIGQSIGLMIGAVCNVQNGTFVAAMSTGIFVTMSGFIMPITSTPVYLKWLCYGSYSKYALQTMLVGLYTNRSDFYCGSGICFFRDPMMFVKYLKMDGDLFTDYCVLLAFLVIFRISGYWMLKLRSSSIK